MQSLNINNHTATIQSTQPPSVNEDLVQVLQTSSRAPALQKSSHDIAKLGFKKLNEHIKKHFKPILQHNPGHFKVLQIRMIKNLLLLKRHHILYNPETLSDFNSPLFSLLISKEHVLENTLCIAKYLGIRDEWNLMRIHHAFFKWKEELFFETDLFEECIAYFGKQEIQNIFTYDGAHPTELADWLKPNPRSNWTMHQRMEQACAIIDFCTHTGFPSGERRGISLFLDGVQKPEFAASITRQEDVHYLGSFAPEVRYLIEKLGIPFDKIFALDPKIIARHCGVLRSLQKFAYNRHTETLVKNFDIRTGRQADEISLEDVFGKENIFYYFYRNYSPEDLKALFQFIKDTYTHSHPVLTLETYIKLTNSPVAVEAAKQYTDIKKYTWGLVALETIKRDGIIAGKKKSLPSFLSDKNMRAAMARHRDMKVLIKNSSLLNTFDRDPILQGKKELPQFLVDEKLREAIKTYGKIRDITQVEPPVDRDICLQDTSQIPSYLVADIFANLVYEYNELKKYIVRNDDHEWPDRVAYYTNPKLLHIFVVKLRKLVQSPLKNIAIITSLSQNLSIKDKWHLLLSSSDMLKGSMEHIINASDKWQIAKLYRYMYETHMGLYSIGWKIHVDSPIPEEKVKQFAQEKWLKQTMFKLIHANTSVLLPPSYFAAELVYMIARMGEAWFFAESEKPQLQISIPGRMSNHLGWMLGSSMILLSQTHVEYTKESFDTTHNSETWRRMVTYDAGNYDPTFNWNTDKIKGRTDVLLLRDINLMSKAQIIGSLLSQTEHDGMFAELGIEFIRDYCELLAKHGLDNLIHQPWIYDAKTAKDEENLDQHFEAVKAFTDRQKMDRFLFNATNSHKGLLVFDLNNLLQTYIQRIKSIQQRFK